jgi:hypothetical protein
VDFRHLEENAFQVVSKFTAHQSCTLATLQETLLPKLLSVVDTETTKM